MKWGIVLATILTLPGSINLFFPAGPACADEPVREEIRLSRVWEDIKHVGTSPVRMGPSDWAAWLGILGITGILFSQDGEIRDAFQDLPENISTAYSAHLGSWAGDGRIVYPLFAITGIGGYFLKQPRLVRVSIGTLEAMTLAGLFVQIPKSAFGRARPSRELGPYTFDGPNLFDTGFHSLPSGHAAVSGAIAGVLLGEFDSIIVDTLAFILVGCTAFERVYADRHWASDAFLGSAVGVAAGRSIARYRKKHSRNILGLRIIPTARLNYSGVQILLAL